jgi:septal ring-binding cell division protein DamX
MRIVIVLLASCYSLAFAAENYSAETVLDSHVRSIASEQLALYISQVRDRPFTVQVASHLNELNAIEHVERLKADGFKAFYYPNFIKNQVLFKVCTGRFATQNKADAYRAELVKVTNENLSVVASLLSRPGSDSVATQALLKGIKKAEKEAEAYVAPKRRIASVVPSAAAAAEVVGKKVYSLQVAAFPNEQLAQDHAKKVEKEFQGQDVFYRTADVNGKTWYRLFVGRYNEYQAATAAKNSFQTGKYANPIVRKLFE